MVAGLTRICDVHGYNIVDGKLVPDEGKLTLRGYSIEDLINSSQAEGRFGYEEVAYLLITGALPNADELADFQARLGAYRHISDGYVAQFPITTVSSSIMNVLMRAVLLLYAFDAEPDNISPEHEIDVAVSMLSRLPRIAAMAHALAIARQQGRRALIPTPDPKLSTAETILQVLRGDTNSTRGEAMLLNVTCSCSTPSTAAATTPPSPAVCCPVRHGRLLRLRFGDRLPQGPAPRRADSKVVHMHEDIRNHVKNWDNDDEIAAYLEKILRREAFDGSGLIYGMGHAVYTLSDPRAKICRHYAEAIADEKGLGDEFRLIESVERLAPQVMRDVRGTSKPICANIDLYTGFIYSMLGIPQTLFTPMFAVARTAGWAAHRMEELFGAHRIIARHTTPFTTRWSTYP